jgi:predicted ArsR family transcriptional regulator
MPSTENRMKALRALEKEALTTQEVAVRVGVGYDAARNHIDHLLADGKIRPVGNKLGPSGRTYRMTFRATA